MLLVHTFINNRCAYLDLVYIVEFDWQVVNEGPVVNDVLLVFQYHHLVLLVQKHHHEWVLLHENSMNNR